jgi:hypothetical protein
MLTSLEREFLDAARKALNFIANTESELNIKLASGDALRAVIAKAEALDMLEAYLADTA